MVLDWIKKNFLVVAMGTVIIGLIVAVAWPKTPPLSSTEAIKAAVVILDEQYKTQMTAKDEQIKAYQAKVLASEKKYQEIMIKVKELQRMKDNVKTPKDAAESRDRFNALGFPATPVKQ